MSMKPKRKRASAKCPHNIICYLILFFDMLSLVSFFILLRYFEYNDQLQLVVNLYNYRKIIYGIIIATVPICWGIQRIQKKKMNLFYALIILCIPIFFISARGEVPDRFKKLHIVNSIHQGHGETMFSQLNYFDKQRLSYAGNSGCEDVFFLTRGEIKKEGQYYKTAYLYSEDDQLNDTFFVPTFRFKELKHLNGKWYHVTFEYG